MITVVADNKKIDIEWIEFSDGALTCKVDPIIIGAKDYISLCVNPRTPIKQVAEEINLVRNAIFNLDKNKDIAFFLTLEYLPYGRADRVFEEGNPAPLSLFLSSLEEWCWEQVTVVDPHNPEKLKGRDIDFNIVQQDQCFNKAFNYNSDLHKWDYIISPDKGATEKACKLGKCLSTPVVQADKKRDLSTGRIIETTLDQELPSGSRVIIVDDILDGGGTFIPLAKKLRSQGCTVDLYVTHLIASKGLDIFKGLIDNIYCYHTVGKYINKLDVTFYNEGI